MKYCSTCGETVELRIPEDDNRERYCCASCDTIHYQNPRMVLGTLPVYGDKILLCKRAIEPRHGYWTLPAGFMENGETISQGSCRETDEEADIDFELGDIFSIMSVPHVGQVHLFYLARMTSDRIGGGPETLEARLFSEEEIPWPEIAFHTVEKTLRWFLEDRRQGTFTVHSADVNWAKRKQG